jgi:hypothetical protein
MKSGHAALWFELIIKKGGLRCEAIFDYLEVLTIGNSPPSVMTSRSHLNNLLAIKRLMGPGCLELP